MFRYLNSLTNLTRCGIDRPRQSRRQEHLTSFVFLLVRSCRVEVLTFLSESNTRRCKFG